MLRIGMNLVDAKKRLLAHGAEETGYEIATMDPKVQLRWFKLPSGTVIELISRRDDQDAYKLEKMRISTYEEKSWQSKLDPERDKFFESFKSINEYDLSLPPEMQPPANTTKATP